MEQSSPGRRGGGRAARQAARTARSIESVPFLTRNLAPVEVLGEDRAIEAVGGSFHEFSGNNSYGLTAEVLPGDAALALELISDAVLRPAAQALLGRVTTVEDPDIKIANNPVDEGHVEVAVTTRDGRRVARRVTHPIGSSEIPLPWEELAAKFRDCAADVLDDGRIDRAITAVATLDRQATLGELIAALTPA